MVCTELTVVKSGAIRKGKVTSTMLLNSSAWLNLL